MTLLALAELTACSAASARTPTPGSPSCPEVQTGPIPDPKGAAVIMIDDSTSARTLADEQLRPILTAVVEQDVRLTVATFSDSDAAVQVSPCFNDRPFRPFGNNSATRGRNLTSLLDAATAAALSLPSSGGETDVLSPFRVGVEVVNRAEPDDAVRQLVIIGDGLPTAGCAALADGTDPTASGLVERIVAQCRGAGAIPDATGVDIVVIGVGRTEVPLSTESVALLTRLNAELCIATGADSCRLVQTTPGNL